MDIIEEYIVELEKDVKLDQFNIRDYQMRLPAYKHKWVGRLMRHKFEIVKLRQEKENIKKKVISKIQASTTYKLSKPAAAKASENHENIVSISNKINELGVVVEFLEKAEKILSSLTFDIKNLIEIMKLETT